jgi:hypothetical protein
MTYRPWGPIKWVLSLSDKKNWHFIGAIGTTERSLTCWSLLNGYNILQEYQLADIRDVESIKYRAIANKAFKTQLGIYLKGGGSDKAIKAFHLMEELYSIQHFAKTYSEDATSIILDVTSLPKRFFFPILRTFLNSKTVKNIMITYTAASDYASDNPLYEDIESWKPLPGFCGEVLNKDKEQWIVSVGLLVETLRQYLGDNPGHERMKLLVPFPAQLSIQRRSLESVARLEGGKLQSDKRNPRFEKFYVDSYDMSSTYDRIISIAQNSQKPIAFAPFGPKPISVAMCLYAVARECAVYYPQPTVYNPNYAIGIRDNDPLKAISAYWIRHEGEDLFAIP